MSHLAYESEIAAAIRRTEQLLNKLTREKNHVTHFGATEIDPKHLAVWLCVQSDREVERLYSQIMDIRQQVHACFHAEKYPEAAVGFIGVQIASQETVTRDYAGNWWYFFK
jgi:acetolactate synthase regulatory subunit